MQQYIIIFLKITPHNMVVQCKKYELYNYNNRKYNNMVFYINLKFLSFMVIYNNEYKMYKKF